MSYKVLARKWRPQHFRDMIGQEPVLRALVNALDSDRLHHAYLFTGMRGVGKTTIARIFAKCLNCETNGVSSNPCGECSACKDIEAGRFFDLIEVDAASRTKVEETRELLENVPYAPASGRYKVYLIDEVHMFSNHSFNALLKTLEEPPEHVKFLLATTDPQKVPVTVLSRCLQFNLKRMAPGILTDYLTKILGEESIKCERPALDLIARASEGSVRDSLSLVEQAVALGDGAVRESDVESMLGRASVDRLLGLIESLGLGQLSELFERVEQLAEYAPDFTELMGELLSLLHKIAMIQSVPGSVTDKSPGYERLSSLANTIAPDEVQLFYQIGMHARRDMPFAPDPREAFDMALLRMSAFKPQGAFGDNGSSSAGISGQLAQPLIAPGNTPSASASLSQGPADRQNAPNSPVKQSSPSLAVRGEVSAGGSPRAAALAAARGEVPPVAPAPPPIVAATIPAATIPAAQPAPSSPTIDKANIKPSDWHQIVAELDISGMPRQLASQTELVGFSNNRIQLRLQSTSEHLNTQRFFERVNAALNDWMGQEVRVDIALVDEKLRTPANIDEEYVATEMAAARLSIGEDPVVRQLIDRVDASVDESSIQPIGEK
jgi:DNA polymerase-3 subunit gamma/tau